MKIPIINSVQIINLIKEYMLVIAALQLSKKKLRTNALNAKKTFKILIIKNAKNVSKNMIPNVLMRETLINLFATFVNKLKMLQKMLRNKLYRKKKVS